MKRRRLHLKKALAIASDAPMHASIVARGENEIAEDIIKTAKAHGIPIHEQPEVIALLSTIETGDDIPEALYDVIAEVIAFTYSLSEEKRQH